MSDFNQALDYLHSSLVQLQKQGKSNLTASKQALETLVHAEPARVQCDTPVVTDSSVESVASQISQNSQFSQAPSLPAAPGLTDPSQSKSERMEALRKIALNCQKCPHLVQSRTQVVFGVGNINAELMFVGEAPGADEDLQGEPFVGKAGQLLTKIIAAMGLSREDVFIGNVLKCRPDMPANESGNRKPRADEMATCLPYLAEQINIIKPKALVALGATAMQGLTGSTDPMNQLRGRWHQFKGIPLMATYHPAYLLRNQANSEKRKVWEDLLQVMEKLQMPISAKQRNYFT